VSLGGKIHKTTAMVFVASLWPALLMAFTRYSNCTPRGVAMFILGEGLEGGLLNAVDEYNPVRNRGAIAL